MESTMFKFTIEFPLPIDSITWWQLLIMVVVIIAIIKGDYKKIKKIIKTLVNVL